MTRVRHLQMVFVSVLSSDVDVANILQHLKKVQLSGPELLHCVSVPGHGRHRTKGG